MKVDQVITMLMALGEISSDNRDAKESLKKLSSLFQKYENQDIKKLAKFISQVRIDAGLQK